MAVDESGANTSSVEDALRSYLSAKLATEVAPDLDLFDSGLVTSMFAMELVVYLESSFSVTIVGPDLKTANFRSVRKMVALVHRLRNGGSDG